MSMASERVDHRAVAHLRRRIERVENGRRISAEPDRIVQRQTGDCELCSVEQRAPDLLRDVAGQRSLAARGRGPGATELDVDVDMTNRGQTAMIELVHRI